MLTLTKHFASSLFLSLTCLLFFAHAQSPINLNDPATLAKVASQAASNLLALYPTNSGGGAYPQSSVDWFQSGMIWGSFIDHKKYVGFGDMNFVGSCLAQSSYGMTGDFLDGANAGIQATLQGKWNDDIAWWALSVTKYMQMFGKDVTLPGGAKAMDVTVTTWNQVIDQWDDKCGGGIYWSRNRLSAKMGSYKSTITNTEMMLLSAQLYQLTGDVKYKDAFKKILAWLSSSGIIDNNHVYDGMSTSDCVGTLVKYEWTYSSGTLLGAYAYMYSTTKDLSYQNAANQLLQTILVQYTFDGVLAETIYEPTYAFNASRNSKSFKNMLIRNLVEAFNLFDSQSMKDQIKQVITTSVAAMVKKCDANWNCPWSWVDSAPGPYPNTVQNQAAAMELFTAAAAVYRIQVQNMDISANQIIGTQNGNIEPPSSRIKRLTPLNGATGTLKAIQIGFTITIGILLLSILLF